MLPVKPYMDMIERLAGGESLLRGNALALQEAWRKPPEDVGEWMELMLRTQRLCKIGAAGQENNAELIVALEAATPKRWADAPDMPCKPGRQQRQAETMLNQLKVGAGDRLLLECSFLGRRTAEAALRRAEERGATVDFDTADAEFNTVLVNALDEPSLEQYCAFQRGRQCQNTHAMYVRGKMDDAIAAQRDPEKFATYSALVDKPFTDLRTTDKVRWILSDAPTPSEAADEGMDYAEYLDMFFDACDQPWPQITKAQAHLIKAFNAGKELRFTNDDGTDVSLSIDGQQFANSVVARNLPGSEIFSGPVKESVNGTLVSKGKFGTKAKGKNLKMEDLTLRIENGRVMEGTARLGDEDLQTVLSSDDHRDPSDPKFEGSRHFGEIGIGTNPFIRQHLRNTLLCEKIGGSFHLAIGSCYGDKYLGEPCKMSNGNDSAVHWDLTTMLRGKGGRMYLDGHLVQKDGEWIGCPELGIDAKELDVLNKGWAALPEKDRPKYWREKLAAEAERAR